MCCGFALFSGGIGWTVNRTSRTRSRSPPLPGERTDVRAVTPPFSGRIGAICTKTLFSSRLNRKTPLQIAVFPSGKREKLIGFSKFLMGFCRFPIRFLRFRIGDFKNCMAFWRFPMSGWELRIGERGKFMGFFRCCINFRRERMRFSCGRMGGLRWAMGERKNPFTLYQGPIEDYFYSGKTTA